MTKIITTTRTTLRPDKWNGGKEIQLYEFQSKIPKIAPMIEPKTPKIAPKTPAIIPIHAPIKPATNPKNPPAKPIQIGNVKIRSKTIKTVELEEELRVDISVFLTTQKQESFRFVDVGNLPGIPILYKVLRTQLYKSEQLDLQK